MPTPGLEVRKPTIAALPARRLWCFRLLAMMVGLSPFLMLEVGLRWAGLGDAAWQGDPFVGFQGGQPLFVLNESRDRFEIAKSRLTHFQPDSFAATKGSNEYRVFCLGGSTVQGNPYTIETSFTTWLELALRAAEPTREWRVVNCGGISYATYRLAPILEELLEYEPDLFIVYTGQNEFLEDRSYASARDAP